MVGRFVHLCFEAKARRRGVGSRQASDLEPAVAAARMGEWMKKGGNRGLTIASLKDKELSIASIDNLIHVPHPDALRRHGGQTGQFDPYILNFYQIPLVLSFPIAAYKQIAGFDWLI